jgi:hypothetical protein
MTANSSNSTILNDWLPNTRAGKRCFAGIIVVISARVGAVLGSQPGKALAEQNHDNQLGHLGRSHF